MKTFTLVDRDLDVAKLVVGRSLIQIIAALASDRAELVALSPFARRLIAEALHDLDAKVASRVDGEPGRGSAP